jgi:UDP-galactopyranose mutase
MNIVCLSHLRWDFVFQRPQHLLRREAQRGSVLYIEEPTPAAGQSRMDVHRDATGLVAAVPRLDETAAELRKHQAHRELVEAAMHRHIGEHYVLWLYTPMAIPLTHQLRPAALVYDLTWEQLALRAAILAGEGVRY